MSDHPTTCSDVTTVCSDMFGTILSESLHHYAYQNAAFFFKEQNTTGFYLALWGMAKNRTADIWYTRAYVYCLNTIGNNMACSYTHLASSHF